MNKYYALTKRSFDFILSILGILLTSPILLAITVWIKFEATGPIFFCQERVGRQGRIFRIYKFRTMVVNSESRGKQLTVGQDPRITKSGHFLRKYKLDELPQLFNVFLGDMSFVGPRPEVPFYVRFYTKEQRTVLQVRPGITDLASIKYKNESQLLEVACDPENLYLKHIMQDKLQINLQYLRQATIMKDLKIIIRTILQICR